MNTKYSFKDFTGASLINADPAEFTGEIVGSCFAQEHRVKDIFPPAMAGVHFRRCNLDNCRIPPGNTVESEGADKCTVARHKVQNDGEDWIVDDKGKPIEPLNKKTFQMQGKSIDPKDIPADHFVETEMTKSDYDAFFVTKSKKHKWFKEVPQILSQRTEITKAELKAANLGKITMFDSPPTIIEEKTKTGLILKRVEMDKTGKFIPIMEPTSVESYVKVKGPITHYKIRGRAWLYLDQEADEAGGKG